MKFVGILEPGLKEYKRKKSESLRDSTCLVRLFGVAGKSSSFDKKSDL